jgi:hypothetical protein
MHYKIPITVSFGYVSERNGNYFVGKTKLAPGFIDEKESLFAICYLSGWWKVVHRPSDAVVFCFRKKKEAILFLDIFLDLFDESNILYLTPDISTIYREIVEKGSDCFDEVWYS